MSGVTNGDKVRKKIGNIKDLKKRKEISDTSRTKTGQCWLSVTWGWKGVG